ncbi:peroxidase-like protein [Saccostrea echinata]|uniref:peroxidase-like protein n=1 Tax=Saccostrea echinata TaxID=191078 RepID=UPI002A817002|nr:peroxidase-like protein [Saccostrea echinata]
MYQEKRKALATIRIRELIWYSQMSSQMWEEATTHVMVFLQHPLMEAMFSTQPSYPGITIATDIVLNGKSQVRTFADSRGFLQKKQEYIYQTGTNLVCLSLKVGDRVWMKEMIQVCFLLMVANFLSHTVAQEDIGSIVENAVDRAFSGVRRDGEESEGSAAFAPDSERTVHLGRIPARRTTDSVASRQESGTGSGAARALARFSQSNSPSLNALISDRSRRATEAAEIVARNISESRGNMTETLKFITSDPQIIGEFRRRLAKYCYERPYCNVRYPYRRADGQCNNLMDPLLGSSGTPQQRVVPAAYDNSNIFAELNTTRNSSVTDGQLPSARTVSNNVFQYCSGGMTPVSARFSTYLTHHGQFIDHDVIATPSEKDKNNKDILDCCTQKRKYPQHCFNIEIDKLDPFFKPNKTCMHFVRHLGAPPLRCESGVREQLNERTAFVDGSMIYGSTFDHEKKLRGGKLAIGGRFAENYQNLLPRHEKGCPQGITTRYHCFMAGDHRPSETPTLTVPHITWLRRHNLIADALRRATGIRNDEILFQEAKRIVIAQLQHVTYNEFLPALLDDYTMNYFNLHSRPVGHSDVYNYRIDPRTINAFGVAAYRMGHSLVRNTVGHDRGFGNVQEFPVSDHFEVPDLMFDHGYEFMARWMSRAPKSKSDRFLVDGIRNELFKSSEKGMNESETLSFDLGALNVQRGRDHGIPPYNVYREFCGLKRARFFATAPGGLVDHTPQAAAALQRTYKDPDDIDLYAGGLSETPRTGSILGPTFQCLIGFQFSLYKQGDRFWYERTFPENPLAAFTKDELAEIKQTTYSKIMCSVLKNIGGRSHSFQPRLLLRPDRRRNTPQSCSRILRGNRLGFDITPFARQLLRLRDRRRAALRFPSPIYPSTRRFIRLVRLSPLFLSPINPGIGFLLRRRTIIRRTRII